MSAEYGFERFEVRHIVHYKPTVFLIEEDYKNKKGMKALKEVLINEKGFELIDFRRLIMRYP